MYVLWSLNSNSCMYVRTCIVCMYVHMYVCSMYVLLGGWRTADHVYMRSNCISIRVYPRVSTLDWEQPKHPGENISDNSASDLYVPIHGVTHYKTARKQLTYQPRDSQT